MAYATAQNIIDRYGEQELLLVADRDNDGISDVDVIATALNDSTDEINVYVASNYTLPLDPVPSVLVRICVDITMYRLATNAGTLTDEKKERYKSCVSMLDRIASGKLSIGVQAAPEMQNLASSFIAPTSVSGKFGVAL